jgi:SpoIIAA-like
MTRKTESEAVSIVPSGRPDLVIFEIDGMLEAADMKHMARVVQDAFENQPQIDLLIIMKSFDGVSPAAILQADALQVSIESLAKVRRYCVVGAPTWARVLIGLLKYATPVQEKTFSLEELSEARAWIEEPPQG